MSERETGHLGTDPAAEGGPAWGRAGERPGAPRAADQLAEQLGRDGRRRPPAAATARAVQSWVDQAIDQAQRQGAFDDLPGAGKPLRDVDTRTDPDWWVKGLMEREKLDLGDAMPGVMQLRREKSRMTETLAAMSDETVVRAHLEDFNERVLADRRKPYAGTGSPPVVGRVDVEELVEVWRAERAAAERAAAERAAAQAAASRGASTSSTSSAQEGRPAGRGRWWRRHRAG